MQAKGNATERARLKQNYDSHKVQLNKNFQKNQALEQQLFENEVVESDIKFLMGLKVPLSFHKCVDGQLVVPKQYEEVLSDLHNRISYVKGEIRLLTTTSAVLNDKMETIMEKFKKLEIQSLEKNSMQQMPVLRKSGAAESNQNDGPTKENQ